MVILIVSFLSVLTLLFGLSRLASARESKARKLAYQRFSQEDRQHSTLEYRADVTRQRRDTRVWR